MLFRTSLHPATARRGAAVVELAIVLPLLVFLFLVTVDFCRVFYFSQIVENSARAGAIYAGDPFSASHALYTDATEAAKAEADSSISSKFTVTTAYSTDSYGSEVSVTVSYPFTTLTKYPGIPSSVTLTRTVQTRVAPAAPSSN
jgi:Flp pilus assembly protein TadG